VYKDDRYDEPQPIDNIFHDRESQSELLGKRARVAYKPITIDYLSIPAKTTSSKKAATQSLPSSVPKEGDPYILCPHIYNGCGTKNALHVKTCYSCHQRLWSATNKDGSKFHIGQECVYFRPKCGQIWDVVICHLSGDNDQNGRELVGIKVSFITYH
jgi:hypothetical protein